MGLVAERKRVFVKQRCGSVEAAFAAAQPYSLHSYRSRSQLEVGRLRCRRSVGAEDVCGADGLPIGQACMGGRSPPQSHVLVCELASSRTHLLCSRSRMQAS